MVRLVLFDNPNTFLLGPFLSDRIYPRPASGVMKETGVSPPSVEASFFLLYISVNATMFLFFFFLWGLGTIIDMCCDLNYGVT